MGGLNEKELKILALLKPYAAKVLSDPNTEKMAMCIVLAASDSGKEDEVISILDDTANYGLEFDAIIRKIISTFPPVEISDN